VVCALCRVSKGGLRVAWIYSAFQQGFRSAHHCDVLLARQTALWMSSRIYQGIAETASIRPSTQYGARVSMFIAIGHYIGPVPHSINMYFPRMRSNQHLCTLDHYHAKPLTRRMSHQAYAMVQNLTYQLISTFQRLKRRCTLEY
jgi:hypothetical protein